MILLAECQVLIVPYFIISLFPSALVVKNLPANAGDIKDVDSIPGSGRSPGEEQATHSSSLAWESMDRAAWWVIVHGGHKIVRHD